MKSFVLLLLLVIQVSCGVKGDPLPPLESPSLGRGQPNFQKMTKDFAYPTLPPLDSEQEAEELDSDNEENQSKGDSLDKESFF